MNLKNKLMEFEYINVEMIKQRDGLVLDLIITIYTNNGIIEINFEEAQNIYPRGEIIGISLSSITGLPPIF